MRPDLAAMIDRARQKMAGNLRIDEIAKLERHDPDNPFSHSYVRQESAYHQAHYIVFAGNQQRSAYGAHPQWYDQKGQIIDTPLPLTYDWVCEQAAEIARQINAAGGTARYEPYNENPILKDGEIVVSAPERDRLKPSYTHAPGIVQAYWLTIHARMQGVTGEMTNQTWRINSAGRDDIGREIVERLKAHENLMPKNPGEARERAIVEGADAFKGLFAKHHIEPRILEVRHIGHLNRTTGNRTARYIEIEITHEMLDTMLQWKKLKTQIAFHGAHIGNPWRASISDLSGTSNEYKIANEASRRHNLEKTGGLTQTSLAREIIQVLNYKTNPFHTDRDGKIKPIRFRMPGNSATRGKLSIKSGRIEAEITMLDGDVRLTTGTFEINNIDLPDASMAGAKGMALRSIIDHPFIPEDVIVVSMTRHPNNVIKGRHRMPSYPVEMKAET